MSCFFLSGLLPDLRDPDCCHLLQEWNPVWNSPQQIVFSMLGGSVTHEALRAARSAGVLSTPLVLGITRVVLWPKRVSSPWLLWKCTRHYDPSAFLMRERIFASFRSKQAILIRAVKRCECKKQISNRQYNSVDATELNWTELSVTCDVLVKLIHYLFGNIPHLDLLFDSVLTPYL